MFIVVRARWATTPEADVWSDEAMRAWLNPDIEWSLAHCMSRSTFRHLTLNPYYLAPVVVLPMDPRTNPAYKEIKEPKDQLTQGVMDLLAPQVISDNAEALANGSARFIFWFAEETGNFGLGVKRGAVPTGYAVCNLTSPFASVCQEVGHAYGFDHELKDEIEIDGRYASYGSPYSFMSAETPYEYLRPPVAALPQGRLNPRDGTDPQAFVGPQMALANLHVKKMGDFPNPESCITKTYQDFEQAPIQVTINSADAAISAWPDRKLPALLVIPHTPADDRAYYIEFRTKDHYDGAIDGPAVVMHSYRKSLWDGDFTADRLVYEGAIVADSGDTDLRSKSGAIAIQAHIDLANSRAVLRIGKGDAFGAAVVGISEGPDYETTRVHEGAWRPKYSRPCMFTPGRSYNARPFENRTRCRIAVSASGYASPRFRFFLEGQELRDDLGGSIIINAKVDVIEEPTLDSRQVDKDILVLFNVAGRVLTLETAEACSGSLTVGASVEEAADGSGRADRGHLLEFNFRNLGIEWDQFWQDDVAKCLLKRPIPIPDRPLPWKDKGPKPNWRDDIIDIIEEVGETSPAVAQLIVKGLNDKADLERSTLDKLNARWKPVM